MHFVPFVITYKGLGPLKSNERFDALYFEVQVDGYKQFYIENFSFMRCNLGFWWGPLPKVSFLTTNYPNWIWYFRGRSWSFRDQQLHLPSAWRCESKLFPRQDQEERLKWGGWRNPGNNRGKARSSRNVPTGQKREKSRRSGEVSWRK